MTPGFRPTSMTFWQTLSSSMPKGSSLAVSPDSLKSLKCVPTRDRSESWLYVFLKYVCTCTVYLPMKCNKNYCLVWPGVFDVILIGKLKIFSHSSIKCTKWKRNVLYINVYELFHLWQESSVSLLIEHQAQQINPSKENWVTHLHQLLEKYFK